MIKLEKTEVVGWEPTIRGMRNPHNSWDKSDSERVYGGWNGWEREFKVGPNDQDLMMRLRNAGTDHRKYLRMIAVYVDITAPLYWWKEFDTYKVGTVANSCSTMHKIHEKEFELGDFSTDQLAEIDGEDLKLLGYDNVDYYKHRFEIDYVVSELNFARRLYIAADEKLKRKDLSDSERKHVTAQRKKFWWQMIQLLPSSYNQKRTIMLNYEVLANIYKSRKGHKLDEWRELCRWIERLPYSEIITGGAEE